MIHISDKPHGLFVSKFSNPSMHHSSCETWQVLFSHHVFLPQCFNCSQMLRPHTVQDFDVKQFCCLNIRWTAWKRIGKSTAISFTRRLPFLEKQSFLSLVRQGNANSFSQICKWIVHTGLVNQFYQFIQLLLPVESFLTQNNESFRNWTMLV